MSDSLSPAEEQELVRRAQDLDNDALSALFSSYYPKIFRYGMTHLGNTQVSEDFASEVMLKVLDSIQKYRFRGPPFSAWVFRIARNKLIDQIRRDNRRRWVELSELLESPTVTPDAAIERALVHGEVRLALRHLTDDQAQVIALRFFQELNTASVAAILGRSQCSVKSIQHRALKSLRRVFASDAHTSAAAAVAEAA